MRQVLTLRSGFSETIEQPMRSDVWRITCQSLMGWGPPLWREARGWRISRRNEIVDWPGSERPGNTAGLPVCSSHVGPRRALFCWKMPGTSKSDDDNQRKFAKPGLDRDFWLSIIICDSVWRCLKWGNYTKLWWWCYFNCPHQGYTPSKVLWNAIGQSFPGNDAGGPIEGWRCGGTRRSQTVPWSSIHFHREWQ